MTDEQVKDHARQHLRAQGLLSNADVERVLRYAQEAATPEAKVRAREVTSLCNVAGKPQLAASFVAAGLTFTEAQRRLREVCGDAGPFVKAQQPRAALKGNPAFDAMARARFGKRAAQ